MKGIEIMAKLTINFDASNLNELHTKRWNYLIGLLENDALFVDDHRHGMEPTKLPYKALIVHMRGEVVNICPFIDNTPYFCINPLTPVEGVIHLDRNSCGHTIMREGSMKWQLDQLVAKGEIAGYIEIN